MHTQRVITNKLNHSRTYILTSKPFDPEKSRREAYQKWCPIQINWDLPVIQQTHKIELKPDTAKKNDFGYWNQYTKK